MNNRFILALPFFTLLFILLHQPPLTAQPDRWQQHVSYEMTIDMDAQQHRYQGTQRLVYTNNSPDTLDKVFYHLYFNAFQPGSMMDVRSRTIIDPDPRIGGRIARLKPNEQGWIKVRSLQQNEKTTTFETYGTILKVVLPEPIPPHSRTELFMNWEAQVPIQIRRSGRDNAEGVAYSMTQWYPKMCEYDYQGWHADPYVQREFYGVWGDFDVKITIDKRYVVAAGGYLQNAQEVGYGYESPAMPLMLPSGDKLTYHFKAPNVHDFAWAADPDYTQKMIVADDGSILRFFWKKGKGYDRQWEQLPAIMSRARAIMNQRFGQYPYKEYSFIQGGDGGMEYPMATLISGNRVLASLIGAAVHEQLHSWYQAVLGSNESLHAWMDEGFVSYSESIIDDELAKAGLSGGRAVLEDPFAGNYAAYRSLVASGMEEPLTTHADHFHSNYAYQTAAYVKGCIFLHQLEYVIGKQHMRAGLLRYFDTWKFRHPNPDDVIRVFEKESGLQLDWYKNDFVNTTNTIDYGVKSVEKEGRKTTHVVIERKGDMAMPLDIVVTYADGDQELFYAPLAGMLGAKPPESDMPRTVLPDHRWVDLAYEFDIPEKAKKVTKVEIDPSHRMADVDLSNNVWTRE